MNRRGSEQLVRRTYVPSSGSGHSPHQSPRARQGERRLGERRGSHVPATADAEASRERGFLANLPASDASRPRPLPPLHHMPTGRRTQQSPGGDLSTRFFRPVTFRSSPETGLLPNELVTQRYPRAVCWSRSIDILIN
jgi:hypothetical protein